MKKLSTEVQVEFAINVKSLWDVLTQTRFTQAYMFNCSAESDWVKGSVITWQGNYQGYQAFQKGEILAIKPYELIKYSTFDPNFGLSDIADNYIHVTYLIEEREGKAILTIINDTFDGNEERMKHVIQGWQIVIEQMEKVVNDL
ncbi:MAG: SRPBCC domain-containing protein [Colwellia sp.]|nr:SRPBCC domain-containing protein [Colwellia sp.]